MCRRSLDTIEAVKWEFPQHRSSETAGFRSKGGNGNDHAYEVVPWHVASCRRGSERAAPGNGPLYRDTITIFEPHRSAQPSH